MPVGALRQVLDVYDPVPGKDPVCHEQVPGRSRLDVLDIEDHPGGLGPFITRGSEERIGAVGLCIVPYGAEVVPELECCQQGRQLGYALRVHLVALTISGKLRLQVAFGKIDHGRLHVRELRIHHLGQARLKRKRRVDRELLGPIVDRQSEAVRGQLHLTAVPVPGMRQQGKIDQLAIQPFGVFIFPGDSGYLTVTGRLTFEGALERAGDDPPGQRLSCVFAALKRLTCQRGAKFGATLHAAAIAAIHASCLAYDVATLPAFMSRPLITE